MDGSPNENSGLSSKPSLLERALYVVMRDWLPLKEVERIALNLENVEIPSYFRGVSLSLAQMAQEHDEEIG